MARDRDDELPSGPPPAPDERPWRHPSELGWEERCAVAVAPPEPPARSARPGLSMVLAISALMAVVLASSAALLVGELRTPVADGTARQGDTPQGAAPQHRSGMTKGLSVRDSRAEAVDSLGIDVTGLDPALARQLGLGGGVEVATVVPGGPAATGGLTRGDVVIGVDDHPTTSVAELQAAVGDRRPGDVVEITVVRDGERLTLVVSVG